MRVGRAPAGLALVLAVAAVAGCASVPASSPVQVVRQVGTGDDGVPPAPHVDGTNPYDMVRDFVTASAQSADKHAAARAYLAPGTTWDDTASLTVLDGQIDTVPVIGAPDRGSDATTIRIRGRKIGGVTPSGSFEADPATFQLDVDVERRDGQWRISRLPDGVVVGLSTFRTSYKAVPIWFVDSARGRVVSDLRYVPMVPNSAMAAQVIRLLQGGPSSALYGAAVSELPPIAKLRSNVAVSNDGVLVVDLTKVGDLDEPSRRLLAAQVVLSLAEVSVTKVRLLLDGEPLVSGGKTDWTRDDIEGLSAEVPIPASVPTLVVSGGRVSQLSGPEPATPLPGPFGNGSYASESAATTVDGRRLAVVAKSGAGKILLVSGGSESGVAPVPLSAKTMSRPTWTPTGSEVWTVLDSSAIARVSIDSASNIRTGHVNDDELAALGPIRDLRLSRDGMRVAAVVGSGLYVAAVARSIDGEVAIRNIRRLRSVELGEVVAVDWRASESIVAITKGTEPQVVQISSDGLSLSPVLGNNLTPPLTAVAASPNRALLVTDQTGVWSFAGGEQDAWRQVVSGAPDAIPVYPG